MIIKNKNISIIVVSNNTPETMTRQQRYHKENIEKSKKYLNSIMKITKKGHKKWIQINTEDYLRKKITNKREYAIDSYWNIPEENQQQTREYGYRKDMSEENKQIMKEHMKEYLIQKKSIQKCVEENKRKQLVEKHWSWYGNQIHQKVEGYIDDDDADVNDDDDEQNKITGFTSNRCDQYLNIL